MPRPKKKTTAQKAEETILRDNLLINPANYTDSGSSLIQYGVAMYAKNSKQALLTEGDTAVCVQDEELLLVPQVQYLNMIASGISSAKACKALCIDRATPLLWASQKNKDGVFNQCMRIVKQIQADDLEEVVWEEALNNPKSTIMKMFALKARKDEYKDNATPVSNVQTNINVTIDGIPYGEDGATIRVVEVEGDNDAT